MRDNIKVSSVTLNWNGRGVLSRCIMSLKNQTLPLYEIIVVDNCSQDGSAEEIQREYSDIVVLKNPRNYGAPKGRNVGLRRALEKAVDYIFILDNDLFAAEDCVEKLVSKAEENPSIGNIGAFIYDYTKKDRLLSAGGIVDFTQNVSRQLLKVSDPNGLYSVSYCGTGHMLARASVFKEVGLLDESFVGYGFEDTDFGMRVRKAGYSICTYGEAKVWHILSSGIGRYSFRKKYLEARNAIIFMKRYANFFNWLKYMFFVLSGLIVAVFIQVPKGNFPGVIGKARGLIDGLLNKTELAEKILLSKWEKYR